MKYKWALRLGYIAGYTLIGLALFANFIGIDANADWGLGRVLILLIGAICISSSLFHRQLISLKHGIEMWFGKKVWRYITSILLILFVLLAYVWFISVGLWTKWPQASYSFIYDSLATSFQHGQLSLPFDPDPALLALSNPYDTPSRSGINWLMDATLYNGKYYLYFGPVPALILALIKIFIPIKIGDQYLVFSFTAGIFIFEFFLLQKAWQRYFSDIPAWIMHLGILGMGLANPFMIMLLSPSIHAAAITSGQFFLLGGLFFSIEAFEKEETSNRQLIIAGILLACAVGSRSMLAIPVIVLTTIIIVQLFARKKQVLSYRDFILKNFPALLSIGVPLVFGAIIMGWYNWARFGSFTDFGFMYALTTNNLQKIQNDIFSPAYILQNLYNYFLNPYKVIRRFPILEILNGRRTSVTAFIAIPIAYFTEQMVGLLYSTPYIIFASIAIVSLHKKEKQQWLYISLLGVFLATFLPLLTFFWVAFRYIADFFPALGLLSILGLWQGIRFLRKNPIMFHAFITSAVILILFSIIINALLSISNSHGRFKFYNPDLLEWMKYALHFRK